MKKFIYPIYDSKRDKSGNLFIGSLRESHCLSARKFSTTYDFIIDEVEKN